MHEPIVFGAGGYILIMYTKYKFCCERSLWSLQVQNKLHLCSCSSGTFLMSGASVKDIRSIL